MSDTLLVRTAEIRHVPQLVALYIETYPDNPRSLGGYDVVASYFHAVCKHLSYKCLIAIRGDDVLGYAIFHMDRLSSVRSFQGITGLRGMIRILCKKPSFVIEKILSRIKTVWREKLALQTESRSQGWRDSAYLDDIIIRNDVRGLGIGNKLISTGAMKAALIGKKTLYLTVSLGNPRGIHFYESMNFHRVVEKSAVESCVMFRNLHS